MNKRSWFLIILFVLVVVAALTLWWNGTSFLQSQLLGSNPQPSVTAVAEDCEKLSEAAANNCYRELALKNSDPSLCALMSKSSLKQSCQREVELAP